MPDPKIIPDQPNEVIYLFEVGSTCTIDWGDDSPTLDVTTCPIYNGQRIDADGDAVPTDYYVATHTYADGSIVEVKIVGHIEGFTSGDQLDNPDTNYGLYNLVEFKQWGSLGSVKNIARLFPPEATYSATDKPSFTYESDVRGLFSLDNSLSPQDANLRVPNNIGTWDMSNVFYVDDLFNGQATFDYSLNGWNTQAFQSMNRMFKQCSVYNKPMSLWNVENVNSADEFLQEALAFDQDLSEWAAGNIQSCLRFAIDAPINNTEKMPLLTCNIVQQG